VFFTRCKALHLRLQWLSSRISQNENDEDIVRASRAIMTVNQIGTVKKATITSGWSLIDTDNVIKLLNYPSPANIMNH